MMPQQYLEEIIMSASPTKIFCFLSLAKSHLQSAKILGPGIVLRRCNKIAIPELQERCCIPGFYPCMYTLG